MSRFPAVRYTETSAFFSDYGSEFARSWETLDIAAIEHAAAILLDAYSTGSQVFSCGNGGSASIANHLACDHVKGIRTGTSLVPRIISLSSNIELITAIANDISYEDIFTYQLKSCASEGDVLIAISSSGCSANICKALSWARVNHLSTIAFTGFSGGEARKLAEAGIHVDCDNYGIIEDVHQAVMHALAQLLRHSELSPDAIPDTLF